MRIRLFFGDVPPGLADYDAELNCVLDNISYASKRSCISCC